MSEALSLNLLLILLIRLHSFLLSLFLLPEVILILLLLRPHATTTTTLPLWTTNPLLLNANSLLYYHTPQNNFCRSRLLNNSIAHYPKIIEFLNLQAGLPCRANNRNFGAENTALTSRSVQEIFYPGSCLTSPIPDINF